MDWFKSITDSTVSAVATLTDFVPSTETITSVAGKTTAAVGNCAPVSINGAHGDEYPAPRQSQSPLKIVVSGYSDSSGHTEYVIQTLYGSRQYEKKQRYSSFLALHESLASKLGSSESIPFPVAKALFVSEEVKKERVAGLQAYLASVLDLVESSHAPIPADLLEFVGVPPSDLASKRHVEL